MMNTFIIVYYGGTGSSWLVNVLGSIPKVLIPAYEPVENWHWKDAQAEKLAWLRHALGGPADDDPAEVASWVEGLEESPQFQRLGRRRFTSVGFKMTESAIADRAALLYLLDELGTRLVVLERHNRIKHALSLYRSHEEKKNQFRYQDLAPASTVELATFDGWVAHADGWARRTAVFREQAADRLGADRVLPVTYEDLVTEEGKAATLRLVCDFLGLDAAAIRADGGYRKVTPDDLRSSIVNYDEVRAHFAKTAFASDFG